MQTIKSKKTSNIKTILVFILLIIIAVAVFIGVTVFFENEKPQIDIVEELHFLGKVTDFNYLAQDKKSGIRAIKVTVRQGEKEIILHDKEFPRLRYAGQVGPLQEQRKIQYNHENSGFKDGEAEIILTVKDFSFRGFLSGNETQLVKTVTIDTIAPKIRLIHAERYISPGGSGFVIYQLSGDAEYHGADFAGHFHKGHLVGDGRDDVYVAYIGLPYDAKEIVTPKIYARDSAGNESAAPFSPVLQKSNQKRDRINISDGFLNLKIPEFEMHYPQMSGSLKDKYIFTNNDVRVENNQKIFNACQNSISERLWDGKFIRMSGASKAGFADHRTYYYKKQEIDKQVHLGMDIASTRRAEVKAANKGKVVFADYLGIYGNMVILDHGQGVFSLYSHMSQIQVALDDIIEKGIVLGLTGKSGMAGGDHLHFSMLINGIFVTPKEWWDEQWIEVTIEEPLADSRF